MKKALILFLVNIGLICVLHNPLLPGIPFSIGKFFDPFGGFWRNTDYFLNVSKSTTVVRAINGDVRITYDENMIPLIEAENEEDLLFGQGYVLATNRLWQMDFTARASMGKISEVIGDKAIDYDRLRRRRGILQSVIYMDNNLKNYPNIYKLLEAYCAGVNKFVNSLNYDNLPLEYKILNYFPKQFTVQEILSIELMMVDDMGGTSYAEELTLDYYSLGGDVFSLLFPVHDDEEEPVVKIGDNIAPCKIRKNIPEKFMIEKDNLMSLESDMNVKEESSDSIKPVAASNNWSVSRNKVYNRSSTIMASDPHLRLSLPSVWYIVHLKCPTIDVFGYTMPGIPLVLIGSNTNIAWSITNGGVCIQGWYKVKFKDETKKEYFYDGEWLPTKFIKEEIKIKDSPSFIDEVPYTHYGPVVYENTFLSKNGLKDLAFKWTAHKLDRELEALYLLSKAKNYEDFEKAFENFVAPILNFSFASKDGDIAMLVVGNFPRLWEGQTRFIMPGDSSKYDWSDNVSRSHRPISKNPKNNFVSSANQRSTCDNYPYFYHHFAQYKYRNKRINSVLSKSNKISIEDMMKLQNDNYNQMASDFISLLLDDVNLNSLSDIEKKYYQILCEWNLFNDVGSVGASIFKEWEVQLEDIMWSELYNCKKKPSSYRTLSLLLNANLSSKLNFQKYIDSKGVIKEAFIRAVKKIENWKTLNNREPLWGDYRKLKIEHLLGKTFAPFGIYKVNVGGGKGIINANEGNQGASMRMIVEFADKTNLWLSYPGGQIGNPGSFYYDNMVSNWEKGVYLNYSF